MDVHDYGRHFSGFERPTRPRRLRDRYPYLTGLLWLTVLAGSLLWLLTHMGCAHPLGNLVALLLYVASGFMLLLPMLLDWADRNLDLTEEAGDE